MSPSKRDKAIAELNKQFDEMTDDINVWKPSKVGDLIIGRVIDMAVSREYGTTALHIQTLDDDVPTIVYLKTALENIFLRKGFLKLDKDKNSVWTEKMRDLEQSLIAFRYEGEKLNKGTGRNFQSYKVSFQDEIPTSLQELFG